MNATDHSATPRNCVIYARVVRDKGGALERQIEALRETAAARGLTVTAVFADTGGGAEPVADRPGLVAALAAVADEGVGALLVRDINRIARDYLTFKEAGLHLKQHGVKLHVQTLADPIDPDDPQVRLVLALASYEREAVRRQSHQAKRRYAHGNETPAWRSDPPDGLRFPEVLATHDLQGVVRSSVKGAAPSADRAASLDPAAEGCA